MGMILIGILEFICLVAFPIGAIWFFINLFKKKSKKKSALIMILSSVGLIALVMASDILYHDELEQSRIEREVEEAKRTDKQIKQLEEQNKKLEEKISELDDENKELKEKNKKLQKQEQTVEQEETSEKSTKEEDDGETKENDNETESYNTEETYSEDKILNDLKQALGDTTGSEAYNILVNQIGFTNVKYVKNTKGTGNYIMSSSECNFVLTAFPDDKVYRVFQPNGGVVFYEDDTLKMTAEELKGKSIDHNDMSAYYIMAKEIVKSGLKNPRSADFPSIVTRPEEITMSKNGNIIAVQSYVDAENSFGATTRSKWTVQFEVVDISTYSYTTLYVNVDGETLYGEWVDME